MKGYSCTIVALLVATTLSFADPLHITGTVLNPEENGVADASVTVTLGHGSTAQEIETTTNESGIFVVDTVSPAGGSGFLALFARVEAEGFRDGQGVAMLTTTGDDQPDTVTFTDITLMPQTQQATKDTVYVAGTVIDDDTEDAIAGAQVSLSIRSFRENREYSYSGSADENGVFLLEVAYPADLNALSFSIDADGYAAEEGIEMIPREGDTLTLDTIRLGAYTSSDNVLYTINGTVVDDAGDPVRNADVIVTLKQNEGTLYHDTVQTRGGNLFRGSYMASTTQPYDASDIDITVTVEMEGYDPVTETRTISSSTSSIEIDLAFVNTPVLRPLSRSSGRESRGRVSILSIDGRTIAVFAGATLSEVEGNLSRLVSGNQPLIIKKEGGTIRSIYLKR